MVEIIQSGFYGQKFEGKCSNCGCKYHYRVKDCEKIKSGQYVNDYCKDDPMDIAYRVVGKRQLIYLGIKCPECNTLKYVDQDFEQFFEDYRIEHKLVGEDYVRKFPKNI